MNSQLESYKALAHGPNDLHTKHATCSVRRQGILCEVNRMAAHTSETFTAYTDALMHSEQFPCREANVGVQVWQIVWYVETHKMLTY